MANSNSEWTNIANKANALIVSYRAIQSQRLATTYRHPLFVKFVSFVHSFSESVTYSKAIYPPAPHKKRKNVSAEKFSEKTSKFERISKGFPFH